MKRNILIIAMAIISMALVSCSINVDGETFGVKIIKGNGNIVSQNFEVSGFHEISTTLPATVNFNVSDSYSCTVRVDENILEYLEIKVTNHELVMKRQEQYGIINLHATEFVIEVSAPRLEDINLAGSGTFNVLSPLDEKDMEINLAGSGDVILMQRVNANEIELNVAGSGNIKCAELIADELDANVAGSGDLMVQSGNVLKAEAGVAGSGDCDLMCDIDVLEADIAGSGDIKARVKGKLTYDIIGSGDIGYYGNPIVEGDRVGSGKVNRLGD